MSLDQELGPVSRLRLARKTGPEFEIFFLAAEVRQGSVGNVVSVAMKETTSVKP